MVKTEKVTIALYAGSFDPLTLGHLDVLARMTQIFDKVVVGIGENNSKSTMFNLKERLAMVRDCCKKWKNVEVASYQGLTVDFAKSLRASVLIRGVRSSGDLDTELAMAGMNRRLNPKVETLFVPTNTDFFHISSSLVKEIARNRGDLSSLVPPSVSKKLAEKTKS